MAKLYVEEFPLSTSRTSEFEICDDVPAVTQPPTDEQGGSAPTPKYSLSNPFKLEYRSVEATCRFARPSLLIRVLLPIQGGGGREREVFEVSRFSGLFSQPESGESALAAC